MTEPLSSVCDVLVMSCRERRLQSHSTSNIALMQPASGGFWPFSSGYFEVQVLVNLLFKGGLPGRHITLSSQHVVAWNWSSMFASSFLALRL